MYPINYLEKYCSLTTILARKHCSSKTNVALVTEVQEQPATIFHIPAYPDIKGFGYSSIDDTSVVWDLLAASSPALLQRSFLSAIEEAPPLGMGFRYLIFYQNDQPIGIAYFQLLNFEADRSLNLDLASTDNVRLKKWIASQFHNTLLFAGNTLLPGQNAYHFQANLPALIQTQLIETASWQLATRFRNAGFPIDAIVHKDIPENQLPSYRSWRQSAFHALHFQPNMQIQLRPEWRSFDDYLNGMNSKYRVRARRAAKKSVLLKRRWLSTQEVRQDAQAIFSLYKQIADQADFNLVILHPDYFSTMKEKLGDQFEVLAYFKENKMVGFCTLLHNGSQAEAHFLGYDLEVNRPTQLYLNMLYDLIRAGIEYRKTHLVFARTAMEIKSSVGAEPEELYTLVRSYNLLLNLIMPPLVRLLAPERTWEQRHPFHSETQ